MKSALLLFGAMLALCPSHARAQGEINLAWNDCPPPHGPGVSNVNPSCLVVGSGANYRLVASLVPPADMPKVNGASGIVDLRVGTPTFDPWWQWQTGGCRAGRVTTSFDFTSGPFNCWDLFEGQGFNTSTTTFEQTGDNCLRIRGFNPVSTIHPMVADGTEYYILYLKIQYGQATGTGSCAGCLDPALFQLTEITITQADGAGDYTFTNGRQLYATWWGGPTTPGGCWFTPARNRTWGTLKALYR